MWKDYCVACMDLFLAWVLFWFGCLLSLSSVCAGHYPVDRGRSMACMYSWEGGEGRHPPPVPASGV